ncbi:MAG: cyclic nucleotide-binding domain-containing protein [Gammaproteobacteria bacterium]|nr:cyclic nucleotide-binding domain-containing protein [Gammaproteobacteria bacterium]
MSLVPDCQRISNSSLGQELELDECKVLAGVMSAVSLKKGETLASRGDKNTALYLLVEGKLDVISEVEGEDKTVYTMVPGECSGTRAFVDRNSRKATLKATVDSVVYSMVPDKFETLLDSHPRVVYKVMRAIFRITHKNLMKMNMESQQLANYISKSGGRY